MRRALAMLLLVTGVGTPMFAQSAPQHTAHAAMLWASVFGDHRIAPKTSLYWDAQIRRAHFGATWQQTLSAVGVTRDLSPRWRATLAMDFTHIWRYGDFPSKTEQYEVRPWVQVAGTRRVGAWTWTDRSRTEFRLLHPSGDLAAADADWNQTVVRLRRQDRVQHALGHSRTWYAAGVQEFFVNVAPQTARVAMLEQTRTQALVGRQVSAHTRMETGYGLQRVNRHGGYEMNHTLLLYLRTSAPIR